MDAKNTLEFKRVQLRSFPGHYVKCRLTTPTGGTSEGWAESLSLKQAKTKARSEAFERLMVQVLAVETGNPSTSNGVAAGSTRNTAIERAEAEAVERHCLLSAWHKQSAWQANLYRHHPLLSIAHLEGWVFKSFYISNTSDFAVLALFGLHQRNGAVFDSIAIRKKTVPFLASKLALSVLRQISLRKNDDVDLNFELPHDGQPIDHDRFYRLPRNLCAFDFLDRKDASTGTINVPASPSVNHCVLLKGTSTEPWVVQFHNEKLIQLDWGKKTIVPNEGANLWPHPLA